MDVWGESRTGSNGELGKAYLSNRNGDGKTIEVRSLCAICLSKNNGEGTTWEKCWMPMDAAIIKEYVVPIDDSEEALMRTMATADDGTSEGKKKYSVSFMSSETSPIWHRFFFI